jgi:hypothetical protein
MPIFKPRGCISKRNGPETSNPLIAVELNLDFS